MRKPEINLQVTVNGMELSEFMKEIHTLIETLEKARSLINELSDDMASIKFEITTGSDQQLPQTGN